MSASALSDHFMFEVVLNGCPGNHHRLHYASSYVILDTPGQIEIFTWSASGAIITDAVAASFPTVVAYVIDTARTTAPATFMSNMLYACRWAFLVKNVFNMSDPFATSGMLRVPHSPQHSIQDQTTIHPCFQQNRRTKARFCC